MMEVLQTPKVLKLDSRHQSVVGVLVASPVTAAGRGSLQPGHLGLILDLDLGRSVSHSHWLQRPPSPSEDRIIKYKLLMDIIFISFGIQFDVVLALILCAFLQFQAK